jgi:membrane-associated phospholipid phosphatase
MGLLVELDWEPLVRLDRAVTDGVTTWTAGRPALVDSTLVLTDALGPWPLRSLLVVVAVVLAVRGHRRAAIWTLAVTALGSLAGAGLKLLVSRDRPVPADPLLDETGFAWPSGHASTAALAAGILVALATPAVRRWLATLVVAAALVGASRVVLGVHWASDVVSGWLLGVAVVLAAVALAPPYGGRPGPERGGRPEPDSGGRNPSPPPPADHR